MDFICKISIGLAVTWLFYCLLLRRLTFYRWNRLFLLVYPAMTFLVPFIDITDLLPHQGDNKAWLSAIPVLEQYSFRMETQEGFSWVSPAAIGLLVLAAGSIFMTARFCWQYWSLRKTVSGAVLLADDDARLYHVDKRIVPFSFGRSIYLNKHLHTEAELQEILRHEFIHVKQRHSLDMLWGELLCILNWYNPFAWLLRKAIRQNLEFIADHQVLANGVDRKQYQYLLLKVTGIATFSAANNFNLSSLKKRIIMMNKKTSASVHLLRFVLVVPVLAVSLLAFRSVTRTELPSPANLMADRIFSDTTKNPDQSVILTATGDTLYLSGLNITVDTVPGNRKITKQYRDAYISIHQKDNKATVTKKDGEVENYDLSDPKQKKIYLEKYGQLMNPPPPPPPPAAPGKPSTGNLPAPPAPPAKPSVKLTPAPSAPTSAPGAPVAPAKNDEVVVVGYKAESQAATAPKNDEVVVVGYKSENKAAAASKNNEVVVVGHATKTKATGNVVPGVKAETVVEGKLSNSPVLLRVVKEQTKPMYVIDGKITPDVELNKIAPASIESVHVLKGEDAVDRYGSQAKNGVVEVRTKVAASANIEKPVKIGENLCELDAVIFIDGKKVGCEEASKFVKDNKDKIVTVSIFKGSGDVKKETGEDAKNAIIIKTRKAD